MAFVSGPRQVGKTTLAKALLRDERNYFNWDQTRFRMAWSKDPELILSSCGEGPIVFDEIHKDKRWKQRIKGFYDTLGKKELHPILVTGSARLDIYRKGGDSLLGRYIPLRLHPFSVAESASPAKPFVEFAKTPPKIPLEDLLRLGGFPEPLFGSDTQKAARWSRLRMERLLQEDVRDLWQIRDLAALQVLCDFLPQRVGSLLSINNLRQDVGVAYATVRSWIQALSELYVCFLVKPYATKLNRMVSSEPKLYLYDPLGIEDSGKRLENLAALHLLKACHFWTDTAQGNFELFFLRSKDGKEIDFMITRDKHPWMLIECKSNSKALNSVVARFRDQLKTPHNFQLVTAGPYHRYYPKENTHVCDYEAFFAQLV
jgi:predicted AAA+ superfamily ATPase